MLNSAPTLQTNVVVRFFNHMNSTVIEFFRVEETSRLWKFLVRDTGLLLSIGITQFALLSILYCFEVRNDLLAIPILLAMIIVEEWGKVSISPTKTFYVGVGFCVMLVTAFVGLGLAMHDKVIQTVAFALLSGVGFGVYCYTPKTESIAYATLIRVVWAIIFGFTMYVTV